MNTEIQGVDLCLAIFNKTWLMHVNSDGKFKERNSNLIQNSGVCVSLCVCKSVCVCVWESFVFSFKKLDEIV